FVRVASPFAGTTIPLKDFAVADPTDPFENQYRAPFNSLPTYREPGRINLNTVPRNNTGEAIWNAILGLPDFTSELAAAPTWPLMPDDVVLFRQRATDIAPDPGADDEPAPPRAFSLLREPPEVDGPPPTPSLFGPAADAELPAPGEQYRYEERNAWFAYEPMIRAAANTTARSEVYAIWVTMGFFEVERVSDELRQFHPLVNDPGVSFSLYPDGYKLLRERGSDTGDVQRHRAFYLFDRSIPVGYEPGADHNVTDAIIAETLVD
ncbi:MAG: hypothetical protein ACKOEM_13070, partial [Planctomycetia bacterium]